MERAEAALKALTPPPRRGRKQYTDEAALMATIDQIKRRYNVKELLDVTFQRQETKKRVRAYGGRPGRTETTVRYQVMVTKNTDAIAKAERRLGFRLYATNAPGACDRTRREALSLSQAVLTYRNQYIAQSEAERRSGFSEQDFARLHGRHPRYNTSFLFPFFVSKKGTTYVQRDDHACGLVRLLTLALRVMVMMEFLARRTLAEQSTTLSGIYAGNPKRATTLPTAEQMLAVFKEITLTTIGLPSGQCIRHLTPLTKVQELILSLLGMPAAIYTDLVARPMMVCEGKAGHRYGKMRLNPSAIAHRASSYAVCVY